MTRYAPVCPVCGWQGSVISETEHQATFPNPLGEGRISEELHHLIESHYDPDLPGDGQPWAGMFMRYSLVES